MHQSNPRTRRTGRICEEDLPCGGTKTSFHGPRPKRPAGRRSHAITDARHAAAVKGHDTRLHNEVLKRVRKIRRAIVRGDQETAGAALYELTRWVDAYFDWHITERIRG